MRHLLFATAAAFVILPAAAFADAHSEIVVAEQHAGLGAAAGDIATVHAHLHHTLNCLVGAGGQGYDAGQMNPCANSGKGAIPDASDAHKKSALEAAAARTREGIASGDLAASQHAASDTAAMLKKAE
ncbi:MAG: hypothetical protein JO261_10070 [Alphaproteobacteria bacterium]|nr:hypothetical protein [Alphaproteobacteria bacterium]MBV9694034.1 hypothetical protein [Alphaproteobacteria bacterium]